MRLFSVAQSRLSSILLPRQRVSAMQGGGGLMRPLAALSLEFYRGASALNFILGIRAWLTFVHKNIPL